MAFLLSSLLFVPVNIVIAGTGAAFGPLLGPAYALAGSLLAAAVTFAIGRALGRDWVRRLATRRVMAFNRRLNRHGLLAMTVLRLFPVAPFTVVNLIAGASDIRARDYMLGSLIGMSPGIILMTLFGDRLGAWLRQPERRQPRRGRRHRGAGRGAGLGAEALVQAPDEVVSASIRVASYNVHGCRGRDGRRDVARIARVLREIDADVVGSAGGRIPPWPKRRRSGASVSPRRSAWHASRGRCCSPSAAGTATRC